MRVSYQGLRGVGWGAVTDKRVCTYDAAPTVDEEPQPWCEISLTLEHGEQFSIGMTGDELERLAYQLLEALDESRLRSGPDVPFAEPPENTTAAIKALILTHMRQNPLPECKSEHKS